MANPANTQPLNTILPRKIIDDTNQNMSELKAKSTTMKSDTSEEETQDVIADCESSLIVDERSLKISTNCVRFAHLLCLV